MATPGQNVSSKTKKTFRRAMMRLRWAKAHVRTHSWTSPSGGRAEARTAAVTSARELNEHLLQIGLAHAAIPYLHALPDSQRSISGNRFSAASTVHSTRSPRRRSRSTPGSSASPTGSAGSRRRRDHVADADLALQRVGGAAGEDASAFDEGDLVAELLRLAHVVGGEDDRGAQLAPQARDLGPDADGHVGVEAEGRLVQKEHLRHD